MTMNPDEEAELNRILTGVDYIEDGKGYREGVTQIGEGSCQEPSLCFSLRA